MIVARTRAEIRAAVTPDTATLVPTMGALHQGHLQLVRTAKNLSRPVVVSIFVNPKQFGPSEDFTLYPRTLDADIAALESEGVDVVYVPDVADVFPADHVPVALDLGPLDEVFEGAARPGHFAGVVDVVATLFTIVQPRFAVFGQKDLQQLAVVRRLVRQLFPDVTIHAEPIVREADGLALSSRNRYLTAEQRACAPTIHQTLQTIAPALLAARDAASTRAILQGATATINSSGELDTEYLALVDGDTFQQLDRVTPNAFIITVVRAGTTRLLDNLQPGDLQPGNPAP